jgi:hypothetical protein
MQDLGDSDGTSSAEQVLRKTITYFINFIDKPKNHLNGGSYRHI